MLGFFLFLFRDLKEEKRQLDESLLLLLFMNNIFLLL